MAFNSYEFLLLFLPIVLMLFFILKRIRNSKVLICWLSIMSLFFYGIDSIKVLLLFLISITVNYVLLSISQKKSGNKFICILGIGLNILVLCFFKYFNFTNIIFPLGISFITFQQIAVIYDSYKGTINKFSLLNYLFYITFFPKVISGPLVNYNSLIEEVEKSSKNKVNYESICRGIFMFSIGMFKKVAIADTIALIVTNGFDVSSELNFFEGWITSLSYTLQIYFDFSGYSDMAIGISDMFNINLPTNFDQPYKSRSIKEFWQRWHMTLGSFFTRYLYIPLGGNRKGKVRTYLNLFIIFFISGLWHGTGWNFVIWGVLHGIARIINQVFIDRKINVNKYLSVFLTFNFVNIAWVFFRAADLKSAFKVLKSMFDISFINEIFPLIMENKEVVQSIAIFVIILITLIQTSKKENLYLKKILMFVVCILVICYGLNLYDKYDLYFLKPLLENLNLGSEINNALKVAIFSFICICTDIKEIVSKEKFEPSLLNLSLAVFCILNSVIYFNKVSDFIYKSF